MRDYERNRGLLRSPRLLFDVLARGRYDFVYDRMPMAVSGMNLAKRMNLFLAGTHLLHRQVRPKNMPLHMQFELTNYCDLRCPVCPTGTKTIERSSAAMPPELFERVWEETAPYLLTASLWAWGEPLLHPGLARILKAARRHNVVTMLSTNGMSLRHERVREALLEYPPATLIVAIDGLTDETNSRYRVGAALAPILEGVRKLAEAKRGRDARYPVLQLRFIVMRHNEHELPQLEDFARKYAFELLALRSISIYDTQQADAVQGGFVPANELLQPYRYKDGKRQPRAGFFCTMPFWFPTLLAGGEVVACEQDHSARARLGQVTAALGFRGVWFSEEAAEVRRTVRDRPAELSFCRNCPFAGRSTADCSVELRQLIPDAAYPGLVAGQGR